MSKQVIHYLAVLDEGDLEILRDVGQAAAGLIVERCERCEVWQPPAMGPEIFFGGHGLRICFHHRKMLDGHDPRWTLLASRAVELPQGGKDVDSEHEGWVGDGAGREEGSRKVDE